FGAILFGVGLVVFVTALLLPGRTKDASPPPLAVSHGLLSEGERLLKHGLANHYRGMVNVGGWLYLTDRRLLFQPAPGNFHKQDLSIPLTEVTDVEACMTLGIIPNGLRVKTTATTERFVLWGRRAWQEEILRARELA